MRSKAFPWAAAIACAAALSPIAAGAAEPDELAALRAEIAALKTEYAGRVATLEARLTQLEAGAASAPPAAAPDTAAAAAAVAQAPSEPSPAAVAAGGIEQRGPAFNPSISAILTGTYANLSQDPGDYAIAGFMPSGGEIGPGERGFSLGESEITFSASVDPYFAASLTAALSSEGELEVEEAFARTSALPAGLTAKAGRFFSGVGYLNEFHAHSWDFIDLPLAYQAFFGGQYAQDGAQLKWVAPTDLFLEVGAEIGNGDAFPATRDEGNGFNSTTLFTRLGGDLGDSIGWRAGLSWVDADAVERSYEDTDALGNAVLNAFSGQSRTWIADATLKWAPGGDARRQALKLQAEYMEREEEGRLAYDLEDSALDGSYRSRQSGWYVQGVYQFVPRWRAGVRYDSLDAGDTRIGLVSDGTLAAGDFPLLFAAGDPSRTSLMLDFSPSEFSRLRVQYAWDDARAAATDEQWLLQYIYAIGAHGSHKF